jgi:hypothetical protein
MQPPDAAPSCPSDSPVRWPQPALSMAHRTMSATCWQGGSECSHTPPDAVAVSNGTEDSITADSALRGCTRNRVGRRQHPALCPADIQPAQLAAPRPLRPHRPGQHRLPQRVRPPRHPPPGVAAPRAAICCEGQPPILPKRPPPSCWVQVQQLPAAMCSTWMVRKGLQMSHF